MDSKALSITFKSPTMFEAQKPTADNVAPSIKAMNTVAIAFIIPSTCLTLLY